MTVQVVYASETRQEVVQVSLADGATIRDAVETSGLLQQFPEIDLNENRIGIWYRVMDPATPVQAGDRVEIYRPLKVDPKQARRKRASEALAP